MSFDFSTLITDRTQADVSRVQELASKILSGTASEPELAEFNSAAMKGAYNHTDLNRVTAAMEALKARLEGYGYQVNYEKILLPREDRFSDVQLKPVSVESGMEYDSYVFEAPNVGNYLVTVTDDYGTAAQDVRIESNEQNTTLDMSGYQLVHYTMLYDYGTENIEATGGWIANKTSVYYSAFSKNKDSIYIKGSGTGGYAEIRTANPVNLAGYSACFINANSVILAAGTTVEPSYMFVGGTTDSVYYQGQDVIKFVIGNTAGRYNAPYFGSINGALAYLALQVRVKEQNEITMFTVALLKHDDWQSLCSRAGIVAPTTVEELFKTKETITALLGSADTVNYIAKCCTGSFMGAAIASCVFPAFINMSPYKSVFYDNPHWNKFLTDNNMANRAYLYYYGNECDALTGGWVEESVSNYGAFTKNNTSLKLYLYGGGSSLSIKTVNAIECSTFKSLCFKYTAVSSGAYGNYVNYDLGLLDGVKFSQGQGEIINFDGVTTVDISGGSFTDNIFARVWADGSVVSDNRYLTVEITEVWLE